MAGIRGIQCPQCGLMLSDATSQCSRCGQQFGPGTMFPYNSGVPQVYPSAPAYEGQAVLERWAEKPAEIDLRTIKPPNTAAERQMRDRAMNFAFSAYQISCCGMAGDGDMDHEDIVPLARQIEQFMRGD